MFRLWEFHLWTRIGPDREGQLQVLPEKCEHVLMSVFEPVLLGNLRASYTRGLAYSVWFLLKFTLGGLFRMIAW
jgi:hypothetical protein